MEQVVQELLRPDYHHTLPGPRITCCYCCGWTPGLRGDYDDDSLDLGLMVPDLNGRVSTLERCRSSPGTFACWR